MLAYAGTSLLFPEQTYARTNTRSSPPLMLEALQAQMDRVWFPAKLCDGTSRLFLPFQWASLLLFDLASRKVSSASDWIKGTDLWAV